VACIVVVPVSSPGPGPFFSVGPVMEPFFWVLVVPVTEPFWGEVVVQFQGWGAQVVATGVSWQLGESYSPGRAPAQELLQLRGVSGQILLIFGLAGPTTVPVSSVRSS
jgi:hypothetical protein